MLIIIIKRRVSLLLMHGIVLPHRPALDVGGEKREKDFENPSDRASVCTGRK